jgi:hypothetical protein
MPAGFLCTLIPEPFTLSRETGAKGEVSKNQGTGYGIQYFPNLIHPSPFLIVG